MIMQLFMPNYGTRCVFYIAITLIQVSLHVRAYAIDHSCRPFVAADGTSTDKSSMIRSAMAEARKMAILAHNAIVGPEDYFDNSRFLLFPTATWQDFVEVQGASRCHISADQKPSGEAQHESILTTSRPGYYQTLLDWIPWDETSHNSLAADKLTIYCGNANFMPWTDQESKSDWLDVKSSFIVPGPDHGDDLTAGFCDDGGIAETMGNDLIRNPTIIYGEADIRIIVLCEASLVRGSSTDTIARVSRGTLQEMYNAGELYWGRRIVDIGRQVCLSWTLLHELFHVAMPMTSWVSSLPFGCKCGC
jgi:hypothetical protein